MSQIASFLSESKRVENCSLQPILDMRYLFIVTLFSASPSAFDSYEPFLDDELMRQLSSQSFWELPSLSRVLDGFVRLASIEDVLDDVNWVLQMLLRIEMESVDVVEMAAPLLSALLQSQQNSVVFSLFLDQVMSLLPDSFSVLVSFLLTAVQYNRLDFILPRISEILSLTQQVASPSKTVLAFNSVLLSLSLPSLANQQQEIVSHLQTDLAEPSSLRILTLASSNGYIPCQREIDQLLSNPVDSVDYGDLMLSLLQNHTIDANSTSQVAVFLLSSSSCEVQSVGVRMCFESWKQANQIDVVQFYQILSPLTVLMRGEGQQIHEILEKLYEVMNIHDLIELDVMFSLLEGVMNLRQTGYSIANHVLVLKILLAYLQKRQCRVEFPIWEKQVDVIIRLWKNSLRNAEEWKLIVELLYSISRSPNYLGSSKECIVSRLSKERF